MVMQTRARIGWRDLPPPVRERVETIIGGGPVEAARSQPGGFSPGTADRVRTRSGRRAFVKAVSPAVNEQSAVLARREMRVSAALPAHAPVPAMLGGFDDGDWVVLVLEDIDGAHPRTPWVTHEVDAAVTALRELAAALTPAPLDGVPTAAGQFAGDFTCWDKLAAAPPADLDPWLAARLPMLRRAAARGLAALGDGDTLTHSDIRADNLLVRPGGSVIVVDWPWAATGPAWFDRLLLGLNIVVTGGDPDPALAGIDPLVVTDVIAGIAGFFEYACRQPDPPGIPTVRAFQRLQADALRPWLRSREGLGDGRSGTPDRSTRPGALPW
jgi:aminoglycoside phosphotransferase (APT) family kinase protein